jgi:hypothetical protein
MANDIMNRLNRTLRFWILVAVALALLVLLTLSAEPCLAGLIWSG